jgi:hypothetical protein
MLNPVGYQILQVDQQISPALYLIVQLEPNTRVVRFSGGSLYELNKPAEIRDRR